MKKMKMNPETKAWRKHYFKLIQDDGYQIKNVPSEFQTEELQYLAVRTMPLAIEWIENPSETVQLGAVKRNGKALKLIKNPSYEVQKAAVKQCGYAIQWIQHPSKELIDLAIQQTPRSIFYVQDFATKEQIKTAVDLNYKILYDIKQPDLQLIWDTLRKKPEALEQIRFDQTVKLTKKISEEILRSPYLEERAYFQWADRLYRDSLAFYANFYLPHLDLDEAMLIAWTCQRESNQPLLLMENYPETFEINWIESETSSKILGQSSIQENDPFWLKRLKDKRDRLAKQVNLSDYPKELRKTPSVLIEQSPLLLKDFPHTLRSYQLCRYATRLNADAKFFSPYHAAEFVHQS